MPIQHKNIPDAERHEPKGASTATAGQVLSSNGAGAALFVNPNTLANITLSSVFESSSLVNQQPAAVDTPLQVNFGTGGSNSDVSVDNTGVVTIINAGVYFITVNLSMGRANNTGISIVMARLLLNDAPVGFAQASKIDTSVNIVPFHASILRKLSAADTIKLQILRDSAGANDGGLVTVDPVLAGWANAPSASIRIQKITGAN